MQSNLEEARQLLKTIDGPMSNALVDKFDALYDETNDKDDDEWYALLSVVAQAALVK